MDNTKKALASLLVVGVIALAAIGIGFAYRATTANDDNEVNVGYLAMRPLTEDGDDEGTAMDDAYSENFSKDIGLDTLTYLDNTTVKVRYAVSGASVINGHKCLEVGHVYLIVDQTKLTEDSYVLSLGMSPVGDGSVLNESDYAYMVGWTVNHKSTMPSAVTDLGEATETYSMYSDGSATKTISGDDAAANYLFVKIVLYIGLSDGTDMVDESVRAWGSTYPASAVMNGVRVTFTATVTP